MQLLENKSPKTIGLIGHTIINYPSIESAEQIIGKLVENQVDLIELQIPFSEPVADGPLFTKANAEALKKGTTLAQCFNFMNKMTTLHPIPFVFMTYANIIFKLGFRGFVQKATEAGARGAIIPDLPLDIADEYLEVCKEYDFAAIPVVSPNISEQRLKEISPFFDGFIYAVARAGVTGMQTSLDKSIVTYLNMLRKYSQLPIAVGFGITGGKDLEFLREHADYAVVGTQTLRAYQSEGLEGVSKLWQELSAAREL